MRSDGGKPNYRYDRTLRVIMWMDAFLSVEMVIICAVASPIVAIVGVSAPIRLILGIAAQVCALMLRMRAGVYFLPVELNLRPLPAVMRPEIITSAKRANTPRRATWSRNLRCKTDERCMVMGRWFLRSKTD